jgi:hypothetical protein
MAQAAACRQLETASVCFIRSDTNKSQRNRLKYFEVQSLNNKATRIFTPACFKVATCWRTIPWTGYNIDVGSVLRCAIAALSDVSAYLNSQVRTNHESLDHTGKYIW